MADAAELRLIAFNDFHGHLEGAARLAGAIRELRQGHRNSAVVAAGDLIGASHVAVPAISFACRKSSGKATVVRDTSKSWKS